MPVMGSWPPIPAWRLEMQVCKAQLLEHPLLWYFHHYPSFQPAFDNFALQKFFLRPARCRVRSVPQFE
jgi:hypothetical protein